LCATHKILGRPAHTKGNLPDRVVSPTNCKSIVARCSCDKCIDTRVVRRILEADNHVLKPVARRDNERRGSTGLVREILAKTGIVFNGDGLNLAVVGVRIVKVLALSEIRKSSRVFGGHLY
jgi:hypothetical protein